MKLIYRKHAIMRMFERGISDLDIRSVLANSEVIMFYQDDHHYPSQLLVGWIKVKPIHILTAKTEEDETLIITAYQPYPALWENDFKRKRQ